MHAFGPVGPALLPFRAAGGVSPHLKPRSPAGPAVHTGAARIFHPCQRGPSWVTKDGGSNYGYPPPPIQT